MLIFIICSSFAKFSHKKLKKLRPIVDEIDVSYDKNSRTINLQKPDPECLNSNRKVVKTKTSKM